MSLDVLRGVIIAAMILVNDAGDSAHTYWPLKHSEWNGWTPTDLIFPCFLFMVGMAITLAFPARLARGGTRTQLFRHAVLRSIWLFAIGLFIYAFPDFNIHTQRIPGVLQRIAVCYLIASALYLATLYVPKRIAILVSITFALLILYWALMTFVPVPGYGMGHLDPEGNLGAYIDRKLLAGHLYSESRTWDPEGILSTIPAISSVLFGVLTGEWVKRKQPVTPRLAGLVIAGCVLLTAGLALHPFFPINKKLWTSTFVLFTTGFNVLAFAIAYWIFDMQRWRRLAPVAMVFGTNAILAYVVSELLGPAEDLIHVGGVNLHWWLMRHAFAGWLNPYNASLAYALAYTAFVYLLMLPLYRKRIFVRL